MHFKSHKISKMCKNINNIGVTSILCVSRIASHILINVCTETQLECTCVYMHANIS